MVRITDTYPDQDQVTCTVKVTKPDGKEVKVNVKHLIPLELHSELNTPENVNVSEDNNNKIDEYEPQDDNVSEYEIDLSECESEEESSVPVVVKDKEKKPLLVLGFHVEPLKLLEFKLNI